MECIVRDAIMNHMKINSLFSNKQFGFLSGRLTTLQLLNVLDDWTETLYNGHIIDIIYTDFQKAFDSVPHKRLLSKIKSCGIEGNILNWINTFLNNRRQHVLINGICSEWKKVLSRVPQGSVIWPILFVIYINDIIDNLHSQAYLFVDDMKIYKRIEESITTQIIMSYKVI